MDTLPELQAKRLDEMVASGEISEDQRDDIDWIVRVILPAPPEDPRPRPIPILLEGREAKRFTATLPNHPVSVGIHGSNSVSRWSIQSSTTTRSDLRPRAPAAQKNVEL
jgi:hypothetical protein